MRTLLTLFLSILTMAAFAQSNIRPAEMVNIAHASGEKFTSSQLFEISTNRTAIDAEGLETYDLLDIDKSALQNLINQEPESMTFMVPSQFRGANLEIELVRVDLFSSDFQVTDAVTGEAAQVDLGVHYRGVVKGHPNSIAAFSFFDNDVMGLVSTNADGNLVLGKLQGNRAQERYILYPDKSLLATMDLDCATEDDGIGYTKKQLEQYPDTRAEGDCVRLYFEVDYDIYQDKGGTQGATNYTTGIYNEVATLYANESINTSLSAIVVWSSTSPFSSSSSSGMLSDFQAHHTNSSWNGDLGQLLSYQASGGIAAGFSGICNSNRDNSLSFSSIQSSYSSVPTYSWTIMVVTHEFGHLWGSRHTHACVWNGNNTAIDGCSGSTEGSCPLPGNPSGGGTIMSYCHLQSVGINFNNGFGTQPGNVIRNSVINGSCLTTCGPPTCDDGVQNGDETGVDCGGPDCPECPPCDNDITLTIVLDNYPEETSWDVRDSGGAVYASGGTYGSQPDGSTVVENFCVPDGCYDFTIYDSYGDGICCSYGNGSYTLTDAGGATLASGGSFGSSETTNFCVTSGGGPTCSDGIQNGDETGVDCGGSCPACPPTCDDGIQNGDETGVDCGGSSCPPCAGSTTLLGSYFETGWDGWLDGGSDCYRYSGSRSYEGSYSIRIRDNSGTASAMTTASSYDVSGYSQIDIEFYFYPNSMENGEDFWVRYYDGSSWITVAAYAAGTSFNNNSFYTSTVTLSSANYNFPSNAQFRFQCDASGNADRIYIDAVTITASNGALTEGSGHTITKLGDLPALPELGISEIEESENITLFPNPAQDQLRISSTQNIESIIVYAANGAQMMTKGQMANGEAIDVSNLQPGLYFVAVKTATGVVNKKFIKAE